MTIMLISTLVLTLCVGIHTPPGTNNIANRLISFLEKSRSNILLDQLPFYKKAHKTDRKYQFRQEVIHPVLIQNDEIMGQRVDYIHYNPVKRGYVDKPEHWRYSSARNYAGQKGMLEIERLW